MDLREIMVNENDEENSSALIAGIGEELFAIPLSSILTIEDVAVSEICTVGGEDVIHLRGSVISLVYLGKLFESVEGENKNNITVVVCDYNGSCFGLVVETLYGQKEINKQSLGVLDDVNFFSGATILDEEKIAMILNMESFVA